MAGIKLKHSAVLVSVFLMAGTAMLAWSPSVFAGFEWKGPAPQPAATSQRPIRWDNNIPEMPTQKVQPVESAPVALLPSSAPPAKEMSDGGEAVSGFGSALPLVTALQQVLPAGYQFSLEMGVSPDTSVSWEGGKPWQQVLAAMLSPRGIGFRLQNNMVTVGRFDGKKVPPPAPAVVAVTRQPLPPVPLTRADMIPVETIPAVRKAGPAAPPHDIPAPLPADAVPQQDKQLVPAAAVSGGTDASPPTLINATWIALKGHTLRDVLSDWSKMEDIELYWSIDYDYRLNDSISYGGTFEDAVASLLNRFRTMRPQPYGQLHLGDGGPRVLVVSSYDLPH